MLFFPLPGSYAVVGIDVENALQPPNDPLASVAGSLIKTTKCIVYLDMSSGCRSRTTRTASTWYASWALDCAPHNPSSASRPTCASPSSPTPATPRPTVEALRSDPLFPFGNCYHWSGPDMRLDIRIANDGRDYGVEPRTGLPADQHVKMVRIQDRDMLLSSCARKERDGMGRVTGVPAQAEERNSYLPLVESLRSCTIQQAQSSPPAAEAENMAYVGADEYAELERRTLVSFVFRLGGLL